MVNIWKVNSRLAKSRAVSGRAWVKPLVLPDFCLSAGSDLSAQLLDRESGEDRAQLLNRLLQDLILLSRLARAPLASQLLQGLWCRLPREQCVHFSTELASHPLVRQQLQVVRADFLWRQVRIERLFLQLEDFEHRPPSARAR